MRRIALPIIGAPEQRLFASGQTGLVRSAGVRRRCTALSTPGRRTMLQDISYEHATSIPLSPCECLCQHDWTAAERISRCLEPLLHALVNIKRNATESTVCSPHAADVCEPVSRFRWHVGVVRPAPSGHLGCGLGHPDAAIAEAKPRGGTGHRQRTAALRNRRLPASLGACSRRLPRRRAAQCDRARRTARIAAAGQRGGVRSPACGAPRWARSRIKTEWIRVALPLEP